jgi:hypothetical protein
MLGSSRLGLSNGTAKQTIIGQITFRAAVFAPLLLVRTYHSARARKCVTFIEEFRTQLCDSIMNVSQAHTILYISPASPVAKLSPEQSM